MNTLEILNLAQNEENQGKKVKSSAFSDMKYEIKDKFIFAYGGKSPIAVYQHIKKDAEWSFVKEPVDFMTAVKAFHEKKTISCACGDYRCTYTNKDFILTDGLGDAVSSDEILNGTWFIEN